jgi:hypothetical protein
MIQKKTDKYNNYNFNFSKEQIHSLMVIVVYYTSQLIAKIIRKIIGVNFI